MNANELRLRNFVTINNRFSHEIMKDISLVVCGIEKLRDNEGGIVKLNHPNNKENIVIPAFSQFDKYVEPITLTEELTMNFSFSKRLKFKNTYDKGVFSVKFTDGGLIYFKYNDFVVKELFFVHELQNLYFSITGEELVFSSNNA